MSLQTVALVLQSATLIFVLRLSFFGGKLTEKVEEHDRRLGSIEPRLQKVEVSCAAHHGKEAV